MSVSKAKFCAETGTFPVQYNPVNFKFDKVQPLIKFEV